MANSYPAPELVGFAVAQDRNARSRVVTVKLTVLVTLNTASTIVALIL